MINWFQKYRLVGVFVFLTFIAATIIGCFSTSTPISTSSRTSARFDYSVYVEAKAVGDQLQDAHVVIHVANQAPLDGTTDVNGFVRIPFDISYVDQPAILIVEADGYQRYRQEINLRRDMLPDFIQLESRAVTEADNTPTPVPTTPTSTLTSIPTVASVSLIDIPTRTPSNTPTATPAHAPTPTEGEQPTEVTMLVEAEDTGKGIPGAQVEIKVSGQASINVTTDSQGNVTISIFPSYMGQSGELNVEAIGFQSYREIVDLTEDALPKVIQLERLLPTATPRITGQLAIPLVIGGEYRVYIVSLTGKQVDVLGTARQPDYTQNGDKLVVNGQGGGLDKLRVFDPTQPPPFEIGDTSLGGHSHPAWSPDGTQVIYDDDTLGCIGWCIYVRDLIGTKDGGNIITAAGGNPIVDPNPLHPLWTTQNRFVFRGCDSWDRGGSCGIWVMQGNQNIPKKLTNNPDHIPTDVRGDIAVYVSNEAGNWNVYRLNIVTGVTSQLTFASANDGLATISPDGNWVAFLSDRDGLAVWYVSINGGSLTRMFDVPTGNWGMLDGNAWFDEKLAWGQ